MFLFSLPTQEGIFPRSAVVFRWRIDLPDDLPSVLGQMEEGFGSILKDPNGPQTLCKQRLFSG
jgi:hypothetical protein